MKLWATSRKQKNGLRRCTWRRGRTVMMIQYVFPGQGFSGVQPVLDDRGKRWIAYVEPGRQPEWLPLDQTSA